MTNKPDCVSDYWLQRWREGHTGWHHETVMPLLQKHWPALALPVNTKVLVPFCGKTLDMLWLAEQGFNVLGVEISSLAVEQFFSENGLQATKLPTDNGTRYRCGNIEIIQGDLFDVDDAVLASCAGVYDRAALIAQPRDARQRYAREIYARWPVGGRGLVITLEYAQQQMQGPPFSVNEAEVRQLFGDWDITLVERRDILNEQPQCQEAGLTELRTAVYLLQRCRTMSISID